MSTAHKWFIIAPAIILAGWCLWSSAPMRVPMTFNNLGTGGSFVDPNTHAAVPFYWDLGTSQPRRYHYFVKGTEAREVMEDSGWPWRTWGGCLLMGLGSMALFAAWHDRHRVVLIPDPRTVYDPKKDAKPDRLFSEDEVLQFHQDAAAAGAPPYEGKGQIQAPPAAAPKRYLPPAGVRKR